MDIEKAGEKKPSLIEQSHNAHEAYIRAKDREDFAEADRLAAFIEWANKRIKKDLIRKGRK